MSKTDEQHAEAEPRSRFSSDLDALKSGFVQLREDVTALLGKTLGAGRSGARAIGEQASNAAADLTNRAGELRDSGVDALERFGRKISQRPVLSAAIAMGIGFVLAKLLGRRR